jgi:hypothetical protein
MKRLLQASNIESDDMSRQLLQRAMWQMTAYLDVICKRVFQAENAIEVMEKRTRDVCELMDMLEH